uniref:Protein DETOXIFICATION 27-like n=1 Tax=Nelumbo nucifera TaxID=4432 RepID=A0A822ZC01_NELNU|nr:TPA_asm: hypothetical protein HUJ06_015328 [Nelumbo nucifera]
MQSDRRGGEEKVPLLDGSSPTVRVPEPDEHHDQKLVRRVWIESKKLWHIVGPAILSRVASFSMNVITQAFAGHLGDLELASISIANTVIAGFAFGLLLGELVLQSSGIDDWEPERCQDCGRCLVYLYDNQRVGDDDSSCVLRWNWGCEISIGDGRRHGRLQSTGSLLLLTKVLEQAPLCFGCYSCENPTLRFGFLVMTKCSSLAVPLMN